VAVLHVSHRQAIGSPWVYPWIYPWIFPWISTKESVDMDVDMDGKFHIHGKPGYYGLLTEAGRLASDACGQTIHVRDVFSQNELV